MSLRLVVGLGNPGRRYRNTRHNLGFQVIDALAERLGLRLKKKRKFNAWLGQWNGSPGPVLLMKPATFVNNSGPAVKKIMDYRDIDAADLLVVVDDVNLPPGSIRIRRSGGSGGHHGLESILSVVGSEGFPRIRLGIGGQELPDLTGHVLSPFKPGESSLYRETISEAVSAVEEILENGLDRAMDTYNRSSSR